MKQEHLLELYKGCEEQWMQLESTHGRIVYGAGNPGAKLVLIGEAPGGEEEKQGKPFVGQAGKNLDDFLQVLEWEREDLYITNVVKIRPSKISQKTHNKVNRPPTKEEIQFFAPFLQKELHIIEPSIVATLGNVALKTILQDEKATIGEYHGTMTRVGKYKLFPLYHPASIIYNQSLKQTYQEDLLKLKGILSTLNA